MLNDALRNSTWVSKYVEMKAKVPLKFAGFLEIAEDPSWKTYDFYSTGAEPKQKFCDQKGWNLRPKSGSNDSLLGSTLSTGSKLGRAKWPRLSRYLVPTLSPVQNFSILVST
jgi:hypothetical protein